MAGKLTEGSGKVLIASADNVLVKACSDALEIAYSIIRCTDATAAMESIGKTCPELVLIDPLLFPEGLAASVTEILGLSASTRIIIIEGKSGRMVDQVMLFKSGTHGFCADMINPALLLKAVRTVCSGEIWVPRKLISQLISELAKAVESGNHQIDPLISKTMESLTPRELEVARMVHLGGNNKMIARELDISERTVKAHLSAIFRKLDIENRLHLALYFNKIT